MKSLLISNLNNLGDVVCTTAALDLLKRHFPGLRIGMLVRPEVAGAMLNHKLIDTLHIYRYKSGEGLGEFKGVLREMRQGNYDAYFSFDRRFRSIILARMAGIPQRILVDPIIHGRKRKWWMKWLGTRVVEFEAASTRAELKEMFSEAARRSFGMSGEGQISLPPPDSAAVARAEAILAPAAGRPVVALSVRANHALKNWPAASFAALMDRLEDELDAYLLVTGAPGDHEYIDALLKLRRLRRAVNLAGETSIMELVALAARSDLFITLDTGTLHLVGNSGAKNLLCIFTCTPPCVVACSTRGAEVFSTGEDCCQRSECAYPFDEAPCRTGITVDMVFDAAVKRLRERG